MASRKTWAQVPIRIRNRGDKQCPYHNTDVILACIDCGGELVCSECITSRHHRHGFENILQVAEKKKNSIQEYLKRVEQTQIPTIASNLQFIDHQIKENTNHFKSLEKKIRLHGKKMKREIDRITIERIEICREIEKENYELYLKYKLDLKSLYIQLNEIVDECKDTLKTANNVMIIDMEYDIQQELKPPNSPKCTIVEFKGRSKSSNHLQDDYFSLSVKEIERFHHTLKPDVVQSLKFNISTVVSEFTHSTGITSVEKSTSDSVWLSYFNNKNILRVTLQGKVKQKFQLHSDVGDISVSPVTGKLWLCCDDNVVYEASGDELTPCFTTVFCPLCLRATPDNNVVVSTSDSNVTVYSTTGQLLHSTQGSGSVVTPHRVTVCTNTGDIAVCDTDLSYIGGKGKSHVSVFDCKLNLKYQYYGPSASVMDSAFMPNDAAYDTQGHLLIVDFNNKCIQLLNAEGMFLSVVHIDALNPKTLTLIHDGLLCVGFVDQKVKVIKYKL